jgi:hypothetical protein
MPRSGTPQKTRKPCQWASNSIRCPPLGVQARLPAARQRMPSCARGGQRAVHFCKKWHERIVGLQQISADHKSAAVRQLDMGDRQFGAFTGQNRKIPNTLGGPIKLERFARAESQRKKGATPRCLALSLLIKSPVTGKRRNSIVGPSVAQLHQILMQPLAGSALPKAMSREAASLFAVRCSLFAVACATSPLQFLTIRPVCQQKDQACCAVRAS